MRDKKKKQPVSLIEKVNAIWKMVGELPGLMKGIRREMRGLRKRMDELEHQVHSEILKEKERRISEPPDLPLPSPGSPWQPEPPRTYGGGTVMYGVVDLNSRDTYDNTWTYTTTDDAVYPNTTKSWVTISDGRKTNK